MCGGPRHCPSSVGLSRVLPEHRSLVESQMYILCVNPHWCCAPPAGFLLWGLDVSSCIGHCSRPWEHWNSGDTFLVGLASIV